MKVTSINRKFTMEPENDEPPSKNKRWKVPNFFKPQYSIVFKLYASRWLPLVLTWFIIITTATCLCLYQALSAKFYSEKVVSVIPIGVRTAKAAEIERQWPDIGDCEQYRPVVEKYFGSLANEALFTAKMESGCIGDRVSVPNRDGSHDYCLFQINKEKLAAQSLDVCVRRAFEKYTNGRIGEKNWSDFYAVCARNVLKDETEGTPIPKYPKVIKNCS